MDVFYALSEPTRRNIIEMLANSGQLSATDIYSKFQVSPPAISQHLKVLREANLVQVEKRSQHRIYQINPDKISELERWVQKMRKNWSERFERLDKLITKERERKGVSFRKYGKK